MIIELPEQVVQACPAALASPRAYSTEVSVQFTPSADHGGRVVRLVPEGLNSEMQEHLLTTYGQREGVYVSRSIWRQRR